jgi:hypothetical protein
MDKEKVMTKLTNEELKTKAQVLNALTGVWEFVEEDIAVEVEAAMTKLALQLARDVNGLTL